MSKICPICERVYEDEHVFCAADGTALRSQQSSDELIGGVLDGRYVITALLGEGGMGRVYLGHHVHLPRKVAIKVLHEKLANDPAAVARFNREASSASRIEHEHVARVFDFGRMPSGAVYLAMEYIDGRTLAATLDAEGPLKQARVVRLVEQIADGLMAAHRLGIVHRDLKPDNVMITTASDGTERIKIVDFGIAKTVGEDEVGTLTAPGFVTGTPEYMSPEQLLGQQLDGRSDVFALGLLTFRALTDWLPFSPPTPERGFSSTLIDNPKRLSEVNPERPWSPALQSVFDRVFARHADDRYATASEFAAALRTAIEGPETAVLTAAPSNVVAPNIVAPNIVTPVDVAAVVAPSASVVSSRPHGNPSVPDADVGVRARGNSGARIWGTMAAVGAMLVIAGGLWWRTRIAAPVATVTQSDSIPAQAPTPVPADSSAPPVTSAPPDAAAPAAKPGDRPAQETGATNRPSAPKPADIPRTSPEVALPRSAATVVQLDNVRDALDSLLTADESRETPARAMSLVARLDLVLPGLPSAVDSARALLLKANLLKLAGNRDQACRTLDVARPLATSSADRNSVRRNSDLWACRAP